MRTIKLSLLGLSGILAFLGLFCYLYKKSGRFRKSVIQAWIFLTITMSVPLPYGPVEAQAKRVDAYTNPITTHRSQRGSASLSRPKNTGGDGPGKPSGDDDGLPQCPKPESVEITKKRLEFMAKQNQRLEEVTDSESDSETECEASIKRSPKYSETVEFNDGYKAEAINVQLDHILVKHGHQWGIDDIDLHNTEKANNHLSPKQVRTQLTPENREKLRSRIKNFASNPKLESYPNYPISKNSKEIGRAYLCPDTQLFIGIDNKGVIRKAYVASDKLVDYLRTNCT